jgi:serine/threonine protein kinase
MAPTHPSDQPGSADTPPGNSTTRRDLPDLGDSRYELLEMVGEGGMGRVYRAVDRQLDRMVAIKAIRPDLVSKPNVVRRLAREAKFAAQLDHPFICKVHELIERPDGQALLVMEYIEGETLKSVLRNVQLDLGTVIRLARELADALSFAHQRGLIHRDVKPANVIMTLHGHIKVMDFGVAKAFDADLATSTLTGEGHVVGTPAYMSPEQAAGQSIDYRSDIFSFGVLLYECLSGHLPFEGSSAPSYMRAAALSAPKPLPNHVPAELRSIVQKCLAKAPGDRYENFEAVRRELDAASLSLLSAESRLTFSQRLRLGPRPWVVAVLVLAAAGAGYFIISGVRSKDPATGPPRSQRPVVTWPTVEGGSRVSPDGTTVSFVSTDGAGSRLWIRSLTGTEPTPITPVKSAIKTPAWSPDGRQIAHLFRSEGRVWLQIVAPWGEAAAPARPIGGAWDEVALVRWVGSHIYFAVSAGTETSVLWRRRADGTGSDQQVTHPDGRRFTVSGQTVNVDVRADEKRLAFTGASPDGGLWVSDLDGRNAERLPIAATLILTPRWKGTRGSRIVYVANENGQVDIWEYGMDTRAKSALTTSPVEEDAIDLSASGAVLVADTREQVAHLWAVNPDMSSTAMQLTADSRNDLWPSISSTGRLIFHRRRGFGVVNTPTDTEIITARWEDRRLVPGDVVGPGAGGGISADGRRIFFLRPTPASAAVPEFWVKDLDSLEPARKVWDVFSFPGTHIETWAPIGQNATWPRTGSDAVLFVRRTGASDFSYEIVRAALGPDLSATFHVLATGKGEDRFFDLAPSADGTRLAFVAANRRPYRGGLVQTVAADGASPAPRTLFKSDEGAHLFVKGWTRRGTLAVLKSLRPDRENATEIWEVGLDGSARRIATVPGLLGMTARLDASRDRLVATKVEQGLATVLLIPLTGGAARTVIPNAVAGVTFAGYVVAPDGWLLYMRRQTNLDVWLFDFADPSGGASPRGDKR